MNNRDGLSMNSFELPSLFSRGESNHRRQTHTDLHFRPALLDLDHRSVGELGQFPLKRGQHCLMKHLLLHHLLVRGSENLPPVLPELLAQGLADLGLERGHTVQKPYPEGTKRARAASISRLASIMSDSRAGLCALATPRSPWISAMRPRSRSRSTKGMYAYLSQLYSCSASRAAPHSRAFSLRY